MRRSASLLTLLLPLPRCPRPLTRTALLATRTPSSALALTAAAPARPRRLHSERLSAGCSRRPRAGAPPPPHNRGPYDTLLHCPTSCPYSSVCGTDAARTVLTRSVPPSSPSPSPPPTLPQPHLPPSLALPHLHPTSTPLSSQKSSKPHVQFRPARPTASRTPHSPTHSLPRSLTHQLASRAGHRQA